MHRRQFLAGAATAALAVSAVAPAGARTTAAPSPAKFKLGTVTYNIAAKWDLPTLLGICQRVGIAAVELRTTHAHGVEPTISKERRQEVKKLFADHGVVIWGAGSTCEFHSPEEAVVKKNIEECKRFVELVADLGGRGVKVRPNDLPKQVPEEKTLEQIGKALVPCGQAAADRGVEIWVEVHGRGTAHPPRMKKIMEHAGHKAVAVTWNSNADDVKDGSIREYFDLLKPWIRSVHINELHSNYPWRELFACLREMQYDRYTLAEIPGTPDAASGERLLRYYKALWQQLVG
jgi:sugar phosphate isomerase/epimerase